jgi:hypothetical protein
VPSISKHRYEVKNKLIVKDSGRDLELGWCTRDLGRTVRVLVASLL